MNNRFTFFRSYYEVLKDLSNDDKILFIEAICEYALNDKEPLLTGTLAQFFTLIKPNLDSSINKSNWGSSGGRPPKEATDKGSFKPNEEGSFKGSFKGNGKAANKGSFKAIGKEKDMDKEGDKDKKKKKDSIFIAPIIEDVILYFQENGYSEQGARKAFEHYRLADWHDTKGNPVLAWKQKMHTNWFKDEFKIKPMQSNSGRDDSW